VCPVVLVDDYWYWFAWLVACSLRDGSRRRQPGDDVRVVLPDLLLDRKEKRLYVKRDPRCRSVGAAYASRCSCLDAAQGI
jgi:hypothetical protein